MSVNCSEIPGSWTPDAAMDNDRLVRAIQEGDREAEHAFVGRYMRPVKAMLLARSRNPDLAADLLQDVMMEALCALRGGQLREAAKLPAFVLGIARNLLNNHFRSMARQPAPLEAPDELLDPVDAAEALAERQEHALVQRAIAGLEAIDQSILQLTFSEGMKPGAIAERLRLNPEVVRQRKLRATKKLIDFVSRLSQK